MLQRIPAFEFGDTAKSVRQFIYEFWCAHGRGPNLRDVHEGTGLDRNEIIAAYRELELGLIVVVDHTTQNANLLKCQPFSSYPSQVQVVVDGDFHSFAGCAMEAMAVSAMPPFAGKDIGLESYCACCLAPVSLVARDGSIVSRSDPAIEIHVSTHPDTWGVPNIVHMCDGMNFVLGADHAAAHERAVGRRGVRFSLDQATQFVSATARSRMHDYDWPPTPLRGDWVLAAIDKIGVDTSNWR